MNQLKAGSEAVAGSDRPFYDDRLTPYIEIDAQRLTRNLQQMQQRAATGNVRLRPHVKTHKSVAIAQQQIALGAVGITVSKPSEGVVFINGGVRDVLLAYPVVQAESVSALFAVAASSGCKLGVIVASQAGVAAIAQAAAAVTSLDLSVWIKVDVGLGRVGVNPEGDEALQLAHAVQAAGLHFAGLVSHAGHAYGAQNPQQMAAIVQAEASVCRDCASACIRPDLRSARCPSVQRRRSLVRRCLKGMTRSVPAITPYAILPGCACSCARWMRWPSAWSRGWCR